MRHFLLREFGLQAIAVAGLPDRLELASSRLHPVRRARAPDWLPPSHRPTISA